MANDLNTLELSGRLTKDVTIREVAARNPNDKPRCVIKGTLASDYDSRKNADGTYSNSTVFVDFDCWAPSGTALALASGKKGDQFLIKGMLVDMSYTNKDQQKIWRLGMRVNESLAVTGAFVSKNAGAYTPQPAQAPAPAYSAQAPVQMANPQMNQGYQTMGGQPVYAPQNPNYGFPGEGNPLMGAGNMGPANPSNPF